MKNLIRILVLAAIFAWPAVETYRWYAAEQDLAARKQVEVKVMRNLAAAKQKNVQMAQTAPEPH
jgi:hypothetical protein